MALVIIIMLLSLNLMRIKWDIIIKFDGVKML
jgi:hypothetical protein